MKLIPKYQNGKVITREGDPYEYIRQANGIVQYRIKGSNTQWLNPKSQKATSAINAVLGNLESKSNNNGVPTYLAKNPIPASGNFLKFGASQPSPKIIMDDITSRLKPRQYTDVEKKQSFLKQNGYPNLVVDGKWGPKSEAAYNDWNKKQSIINATSKQSENINNLSVGAKTRDFLLRHIDSPMIAGGVMQISDALGINDPLTANALSTQDKNLIKEWATSLPEGKVIKFSYEDKTGKSAMANPDEYKPFENDELNESMRKISGIYGRGFIKKENGVVTLNGGEYDFNQSATRTIASPKERWAYAKETGSSTKSALKGTAQSIMRNIAPYINTVDYDERDQIEKLDEKGNPLKDESGKLIMIPNPDKEKNIALNKTRKRGSMMEARLVLKKGGLIPRK